MEESEKRRERLRAMRTEAASQTGASSRIGSEFHQLSNPLVKSSIQRNSPTGTQRFDYYTDPMAAFSNDNRMSYQNSPGSSNRFPAPRNLEMTPSRAHQVRPTYSPDPRMFRPQNPYYNSRPMNPEMTYSPSHHVQQPPYSPNPIMYQQHRGSHYQSSYANMRSPSFRGKPTAAGSGYGNSPNSGRGRGGNRGFGSHGNVSAEVRPDLYYNKSMIEDPWKNLEPSVWKNEVISVKGFSTPGSRTYSHSDSFGMKKARISEASEGPSSQPSLAAYLAAALNETVGKEGNNE